MLVGLAKGVGGAGFTPELLIQTGEYISQSLTLSANFAVNISGVGLFSKKKLSFIILINAC
jgi:hypothetical protein